VGKVRFSSAPFVALLGRAGAFLLKSHLFTLWVGLCALGFWIGTQARPAGDLPHEELFENLSVRSYRESPSDTTVRFVVELSARGRPFREYDLDGRRFQPAAPRHDYWRSISGTRYPPLRVRGHVNRGFWLELPESSATVLLPDQFQELYSTTLDFVKPVSIVTTVLGIVSGYSVGYRLATWGASLSNPKVQERVLRTPGFGRVVAREAWRRVALEPVMVFAENDPARFAAAAGRQRLYTNFMKIAVSDSNGFVPYEAARLTAAGRHREARAMTAFALAAARAASDTCDLTSADFSAVEEWASLLDRRGHWANHALPPAGEERLRYLGTLSWYGLGPGHASERRVWVGPRLLVRNGGVDGFIPDEVPRGRVACPIAWNDWLGSDATHMSAHAWTAQWMGDAKQFAPIVNFAMALGRAIGPREEPIRVADSRGAAGALAAAAVAAGAKANGNTPHTAPHATTVSAPGDSSADSLAAALLRARTAARMDSAAVRLVPEPPPTDFEAIRAHLGLWGE
jgi:hypothetical protein